MACQVTGKLAIQWAKMRRREAELAAMCEIHEISNTFVYA